MATIRVNIKQLASGEWACFKGTRYWTHSVRPTEHEARVFALQERAREAQGIIDALQERARVAQGIIDALQERAREAQGIIDAVDRELMKLGAYNDNDPHGYMA